MTLLSWNPFARKAEAQQTAAGGAETDSTDPLILSSTIEEDAALLRENGAFRLERIEVKGEGGALADAFLRISVREAGIPTDNLRELWLNMPEAATGFRDLLVREDAALCAAFDLPVSSLDALAGAILAGQAYVRPLDLLLLLGQSAALLGEIRALSGLVLAAPQAEDFGLSIRPLSAAPSLRQGVQHWRVMLLAWDRLQDENEADHALSLLALFQPAFDALLQRAEQSGLARLADSIESLSARLKQAAFETPSYAGIAAAAGLAAQTAAGITVAGATDTGRRRQHNEDAWLNFELRQHSSVGASFSLAAIADGMGGHASGEVASSLALDLLRTQLSQTLLPPRTRQGEAAALGQALRGIIPGISRVLQERSDMEPQLAGMGTTIVGLASLSLHSTIAEAEAAAPAMPGAAGLELFGSQPFARAASVLFWCGDSRAYLLGPCGLARLSADHSYVQELLDSGQIDSETAFSHPQKNIITRCLGGGGQNSEPDLLACAPGPGELVLLCSDGLSDALRDSEIWELARTALAAGSTQGELIQALIDGANAAGGPDNITVLLLQAQ